MNYIDAAEDYIEKDISIYLKKGINEQIYRYSHL